MSEESGMLQALSQLELSCSYSPVFLFFFFSVDHREPLKVLEERNDLKIGGGKCGLGVPGEIPGECELGFTC